VFTKMQQFKQITEECGFDIIEERTLSERTPKFASIPDNINPDIQAFLSNMYPQGLYEHQAKGLQLVLEGKDLCLSTPTASGKSLVFMIATINLLKHNSQARVLALYPSKALIQDQLEKWKNILTPFDLAPGYIDGGVPVCQRLTIISKNRLILMTPDVAHAWVMSNLQKKEVRSFLANLNILILDEAHVYDGVFGTNMAFFIRRLLAVAPVEVIVSSTATIGGPKGFIERLTGRRPVTLEENDDGSGCTKKIIFLARHRSGNQFDNLVDLVLHISRSKIGKFLAFGDSRKMVEMVVAIAERTVSKDPELAGDEFDLGESREWLKEKNTSLGELGILPYRAGYEEDDRQEIQKALRTGDLAGVVSTSALELGLDIGDIDIVLLLSTPPSVKAFWQRIGRGGRRRPGACLLVDDSGIVSSSSTGFSGYLQKGPEPNWLYLENQYVQYSQALCAAIESSEADGERYSREPFKTLPDLFLKYLENELNPTESVPSELYPLKQRAQAGPQYEFPLRNSIEKNFVVISPGPLSRLGNLSFAQALREAYPGAIYYYMARPYRVTQFRYRIGEIHVRRERKWTTNPMLQNMVFPKFPGGVLNILISSCGFVAEAELQVSERVVGFIEQRGPNKTQNIYGQGSPFSQRPITRFFETTGVCWYFLNKGVLSESVAQAILTASCALCGIQERDLGVGLFHAKASPVWENQCQGVCIYDAVHGSLRLSKQLFDRFAEVIDTAIRLIEKYENRDFLLEQNLFSLQELFSETSPFFISADETSLEPNTDWAKVIAPGQKAIHIGESYTEEVQVLTHRYTPQGLMYELAPPKLGVRWFVKDSSLIPLHGITEFIEANLVTGETRPLP